MRIAHKRFCVHGGIQMSEVYMHDGALDNRQSDLIALPETRNWKTGF
jgi:hypothetical protein